MGHVNIRFCVLQEEIITDTVNFATMKRADEIQTCLLPDDCEEVLIYSGFCKRKFRIHFRKMASIQSVKMSNFKN